MVLLTHLVELLLSDELTSLTESFDQFLVLEGKDDVSDIDLRDRLLAILLLVLLRGWAIGDG